MKALPGLPSIRKHQMNFYTGSNTGLQYKPIAIQCFHQYDLEKYPLENNSGSFEINSTPFRKFALVVDFALLQSLHSLQSSHFCRICLQSCNGFQRINLIGQKK